MNIIKIKIVIPVLNYDRLIITKWIELLPDNDLFFYFNYKSKNEVVSDEVIRSEYPTLKFYNNKKDIKKMMTYH